MTATATSMRPRLGLKRTARRRMTVGAEFHPAIGMVLNDLDALPRSFSLDQYEPQRMDQGSGSTGTETCYAHAVSASIATASSALGQPLGWVPSPGDLSRIVRAIMRGMTTASGAIMGPLKDDGADDVSTFTALADFGVNPMGVLVPGRFSDVSSANVNDEPDFQALERSAQKLIVGPYAIDRANPTTVIDTIRASIFNGFPVWVSAYCATPEFDWRPGSAPLGAPDERDPSGGGHATFLDGWETMNDGSILLWKCGSWSAGYGQDGRCLVNSAWWGASWSLWPVVVGKA